MKPTKMRNRLIYQATFNTKSKHLTSPLSKDLRQKYGRKNARVTKGDSVTVIRGELNGVNGKIKSVFTESSTVAIEGAQNEKAKGEKFDVHIHASNIMITGLNGDDKIRMEKLVNKKRVKAALGKKSDDLAVIDPDESTTPETDNATDESTTPDKDSIDKRIEDEK